MTVLGLGFINDFISHPELVNNLSITVEHAATGKMGGIGSYCSEVGEITKNTLFLLVDDDVANAPAPNIVLSHVLVSELLPEYIEQYREGRDREFILWLVVERLLAYLPNVRSIDIHEYSGVGGRISEAARSGLLPESIGVRVYCHGGHIQLERATATWGGVGSIRANNFERSSIENADEVWFASEYLRNLYVDAGMVIANERVHMLGYPYKLLSREQKAVVWAGVDSLSFIGRLNRLKGFDVFVCTVMHVLEDPVARSQLRHIYAIGKDDGTMSDVRQKLVEACERYGIEYVQQQMTREEVQEFEEKSAHRNVFILPYLSDNYSVAILELIEKGAAVFCLRTGGTPELVAAPEWQERLADSGAALAELVMHTMQMPAEDRKSSCFRLRDIFIGQQAIVNQANADRVSAVVKTRQVSGECRILDMPVSRDGGQGWLSSATGRYTSGRQADDLYVLLHTESCTGLSKQNRNILEKAARIDPGSVYSCGYTTPDSVVIPDYIDLAALYTDQRVYSVPCLLLPQNILNDFLSIYCERLGTIVDRSPEYLLLALQSYLLNTGRVIIPLPKVLAMVSTRLEDSLPSEAMFSSLALYTNPKNWQLYRYGALLRSSVYVDHGAAASPLEHRGDILPQDFDKMRLRQMVALTAKKFQRAVTERFKK